MRASNSPAKPLSIRPVRNAIKQRTFLTFPWQIYRDGPLWVPPVLAERSGAKVYKSYQVYRRNLNG